VLAFLKKREEAKKALNRAIELDPDGHAGAFARSVLDALAAEVF
jgi:predicted RNA polymerase sigma factor